LFKILLTVEAKENLHNLEKNKSYKKRYNAVKKALKHLSENPRYPGLQTHHFSSLSGPNGEKIFEAYAEQNTPAAYRIFWFYGPKSRTITVVAIISHP